jgi:hypothetical protein
MTLDQRWSQPDFVGDCSLRGLAEMIVRISCACGHTGLACAERLPRKLVCSRCGSCRYVGPEHGKAILSNAHFEEWLAGGRERRGRKARGERSRMPLPLSGRPARTHKRARQAI